MTAALKVGDVCLTVNTNHPAANEGVLVVVLNVDHTVLSAWGEPSPYFIRRVDGLPFVSSHSRATGEQSWCKCVEVWCAGYKLKRVDDKGQDERDQVHTELEVPA